MPITSHTGLSMSVWYVFSALCISFRTFHVKSWMVLSFNYLKYLNIRFACRWLLIRKPRKKEKKIRPQCSYYLRWIYILCQCSIKFWPVEKKYPGYFTTLKNENDVVELLLFPAGPWNFYRKFGWYYHAIWTNLKCLKLYTFSTWCDWVKLWNEVNVRGK